MKSKYLETYGIPRKFKLLGTEWKVSIAKDLEQCKKFTCLGSVNFETKIIKLRKGWKDKDLVLFHELQHIYDYLTNAGREKCDSEIFAQTGALFWLQVFQQIPLIGKLKIGGKTNGRRTNSRKPNTTRKDRSTKKK